MPRNKTVPILFLLFAVFFFISQLSYTIQSSILQKLASPFDFFFPNKWSFFAPAKPYNYRIELGYCDTSGKEMLSKEVIKPAVEAYMQNPLNPDKYLRFETFLHSAIRLHTYTYELKSSGDSALYQPAINKYKNMLDTYLGYNYALRDINLCRYHLYYTDNTDSTFSETIALSKYVGKAK